VTASKPANLDRAKFSGEHERKMDHRDFRSGTFPSDMFLAEHGIWSTRRGLLLGPLLAALPLALSDTAALAGRIDPSETQVTLPDAIKWSGWINGFPPHSGEMATLYGGLEPGPYLMLMKWYPGYMSAPHTYATDRLSLVVSGIWWVNSGADFDPDNTVPVPAGGFVRRIARTRTMTGSRRTRTSRPSLVFSESHPCNLSWWTRASRVGVSSDR
jgi:hypothetical protein